MSGRVQWLDDQESNGWMTLGKPLHLLMLFPQL